MICANCKEEKEDVSTTRQIYLGKNRPHFTIQINEHRYHEPQGHKIADSVSLPLCLFCTKRLLIEAVSFL